MMWVSVENRMVSLQLFEQKVEGLLLPKGWEIEKYGGESIVVLRTMEWGTPKLFGFFKENIPPFFSSELLVPIRHPKLGRGYWVLKRLFSQGVTVRWLPLIWGKFGEIGRIYQKMLFSEGTGSYQDLLFELSHAGVEGRFKTTGLPQPLSFDPRAEFFFHRKAHLTPLYKNLTESKDCFMWELEVIEIKGEWIKGFPFPVAGYLYKGGSVQFSLPRRNRF